MEKKIKNPPGNVTKKGFPITKKSTTVQFMTARVPKNSKDYNKVASWKKYQNKTNVEVDWGLIPNDDKDEKVHLALSGDDYGEAFYGCQFSTLDLGKYGRQGVFVELNDLIEKYMPNLKTLMHDRREIKAGLTFPDGNIYGLPKVIDPDFLGFRTGSKLWVRRDWLDKLDLDVPVTIAEFRHYLKKVKSKKPNGKSETVPYGCDGAISLNDALLGSFGVGNRGTRQRFIDSDPRDHKRARFYSITDEYKALLEYMHSLYSDGLIEKNIFSIDQAKYQNAAAKGIYGSTSDLSPDSHLGAKQFAPVPPLKGPDGERACNWLLSLIDQPGNFVITDKAKHPIVMAKWLDYFYSSDGTTLYHMGVEGKSYEKTDHGVEYLNKITHDPKGRTQDEALKPYVTYFGGNYPGIVKQDYFKGVESSEQSVEAAKMLKNYLPKEVWPQFTYTDDEADQLDSLASDIEKYVNESRDKFISGELPLSSWKKYVRKVEQMGLDDYMEIQQNAYDRYRKG